MQAWQLAIILKPFGMLLMFIPGAVLVWILRRKLPEGRLKRFLLFSWKV